MSFALVRVDDRLIHGQVVAVWVRHLDVRRIVIVDDHVARDEFLREVLTLAAPPGVDVEVFDVDTAVARLDIGAPNAEHTMLLLRSPLTALSLTERGFPIDRLQVGGVGSGPGRRRVHRTISLSEEELDALRQLAVSGADVELRSVPEDRPMALADLR